MDPQEVRERLALLIQEAKRVERHARMLKQQSAQLAEGMADAIDSQEAHDERRSTND